MSEKIKLSEHSTEGSRSPGNDNEDPRDREIQQLTAKIKRLREVYRRNHEEIHFIPPVSFGELDHDTPSRPSARHRFKAEPRENGELRNRIKFHEFCGMSVKQLQKPELIVEFNSSYHGKYLPESYCMALQTNDQGIFSVKRAYLPPSINLKDALKHIPPNNGDNLKEFLRYIQQCVSAYLFRTADLENLKKVIADSSIKSVHVDESLNSLCLFMELPLINITNKAIIIISTVLEYKPDSFLPTGFTIDSDINKKAKKEAELLLVEFIKLPLSEAYTSLVIKNVLSSDESCDTAVTLSGNGIVGEEDIEQPREMRSASSSSNESDQNTLITKRGNKNNKRLNKSVGNKPKTLKFTSKRKKSVEIDQEEEYKSEDNEKEVNKLVNKKHKTDQNTSARIQSEDDQRSVSNKAAAEKKNRIDKKSARIQSEEFDLSEEDESEDNQSGESNKSAEKKDDQRSVSNKVAAEKKNRTDHKKSARIQSEEFDLSEEDESEDNQSGESNKSAEKKDDQRSVSNKVAAEKKNRTDHKKSARIQSEEFDLSEEDESEDNQSGESNKSAEKKDDQRSVYNKAAEKKNRTDHKKSARIQSEEFDLSEEDESEDNQSGESNKSAEKKVIVSGKDQSKMLKGKERKSVGLKEKESNNVSENKLTEESDLDSVATADLVRWTKRNLARAVSESNFSPTMQGRKDEMKSAPKSTRATGRGKGSRTKQATIKMFFNK